MLEAFYIAKKDWILFLHADSKLSDEWDNSVEEFINNYNMSHVGWFYHKFNNKSWMAKTIEMKTVHPKAYKLRTVKL